MPYGPENLLVYFEESLLAASVADEACTLSKDSLEVILGHIARVYRNEIDPQNLQVWRWFGDIPLINVERRGELMIYAVESRFDDGRSGFKISILFAGVRRDGYQGQGVVWDGNDESLWKLIEMRCRYHFK